jgi:hypothetical protein
MPRRPSSTLRDAVKAEFDCLLKTVAVKQADSSHWEALGQPEVTCPECSEQLTVFERGRSGQLAVVCPGCETARRPLDYGDAARASFYGLRARVRGERTQPQPWPTESDKRQAASLPRPRRRAAPARKCSSCGQQKPGSQFPTFNQTCLSCVSRSRAPFVQIVPGGSPGLGRRR